MLAPTAGGLLLFISGSAFLACPFYRLTLRGLLGAHWVLLNALTASSQFSLSSTFFLLLLATVQVIWEAVAFPGRGENELCAFYSSLTVLCLAAADVLVIVLTQTARLETGLILITSLLLSMFLVHTMDRRILSAKDQGLLNSSDLLINPLNPLDTFGSFPLVHLAALILTAAIQIPLFEAPKILLMAIYITRSLATLSIIFIPANFGGFVQACKFSGRAVASRLSKSKASNVVMNITTE
ncbi:hypothetical protein PRIPAC_80636 [Pristionchus pacificus]|uniref:Uncharacterized protein n=1 Tax=Pristionchus pacificus TaxID=54126 RepID=A0A2A6CBB7_PRIPA|nr:hypothetical protein PRIPAC_80636 [Pristionchus pacificus]|eukprot:PDM75343.1 hypothetical protein PRIPAC_42520 [Pristionchus pacificus]